MIYAILRTETRRDKGTKVYTDLRTDRPFKKLRAFVSSCLCEKEHILSPWT